MCCLLCITCCVPRVAGLVTGCVCVLVCVQIAASGSTSVMWAIGASNTFDSHYPTTMKATAVALIPAPVYEHTVQLTDSLTLNWNVVGSRLDLQAVLSLTAWYVSGG